MLEAEARKACPFDFAENSVITARQPRSKRRQATQKEEFNMVGAGIARQRSVDTRPFDGSQRGQSRLEERQRRGPILPFERVWAPCNVKKVTIN